MHDENELPQRARQQEVLDRGLEGFLGFIRVFDPAAQFGCPDFEGHPHHRGNFGAQGLGLPLGFFPKGIEVVDDGFDGFQPLVEGGLVGVEEGFDAALQVAAQVVVFGADGFLGQAAEGFFGGFGVGEGFVGQPVEQQPQGVRRVVAAAQPQRGLDVFQVGEERPRAFFLLEGFGHAAFDFLAQQFGDVFAEVVFDEDAVALTVDFGALLVEDVVVFQGVFPLVEVEAFDAGLGLFDDAVDEGVFEGHHVVHAEAPHDAIQLVAAEAPHQFVFQREEKAGRAGVALAGGTTAQLVVDAPRFVAFRADDVQPAKFPHLVHFFDMVEEEADFGIINAVLFGLQAFERLVLGVEVHVVRVGEACAFEHTHYRAADFFGQFAAEFDVDAAAGHVGGDGHGAVCASPGDDLAFFGVFARVEHLVGHPGAQHFHQPVAHGFPAALLGGGGVEQGFQPLQVFGLFGVEGQAEFVFADEVAQVAVFDLL